MPCAYVYDYWSSVCRFYYDAINAKALNSVPDSKITYKGYFIFTLK